MLGDVEFVMQNAEHYAELIHFIENGNSPETARLMGQILELDEANIRLP